MATYIPGVCNIGPEEVKLRIRAGWIFLIVTLILVAFFYFVPTNPWLRLVTFFPAAISALGFLQAAFHFCVAFGTQGLFNVTNEAGKTESVSQKEFRTKDQTKAALIIIYSMIIGVVIAIASFYF